MSAVFAEQQIGSYAVFRDQFIVAKTFPGLFSEQFLGGLAVFREQLWIAAPQIPVPGPTKLSMRMLSSGKVRLINGRIQLCKINYV